MAVALFLLNRQRQKQQQIPRLFRDRTNPLDYMTDTQIVHNYRLDRESIYELCHELEAELARPMGRIHALPVSLQDDSTSVFCKWEQYECYWRCPWCQQNVSFSQYPFNCKKQQKL